MSNNKYANQRGEIRIRGIRKDIIDDLKEISKNHDVTLNNFLRPKLKEIRDQYSDHIRGISDED